MKLYTTINKLKSHDFCGYSSHETCEEMIKKVIESFPSNFDHDKDIDLLHILDVTSCKYASWALRACTDKNAARKVALQFTIECAEITYKDDIKSRTDRYSKRCIDAAKSVSESDTQDNRNNIKYLVEGAFYFFVASIPAYRALRIALNEDDSLEWACLGEKSEYKFILYKLLS